MRREKIASRRAATKRARGRRAMFGLEELENKLLMANNITIATGGSNSIPAGATNFTDTGDYTIDPSALLSAGSAITLDANDSITFTNAVTGLGESLDAESHGSIAVDANISSTIGNAITFDGTNANTSGTANVTGITFDNAVVTSGGSLTVTGDGYESGVNASDSGVLVEGNSVLSTSGTSNTLTVTGEIASADYGYDYGVVVGGGAAIETGDSSLSVTGTSSGTTGDDGHDVGVFVAGGEISSQNGSVTVTGTGGAGSTARNNYGVLVYASGYIPNNGDSDAQADFGGSSTSAVITSANSAVSVVGTGGGTGAADYSYGVFVDTGGAIGDGDLGTVSVNGTGGGGSGGGNTGVEVWNYDIGPAALITSGGGNVSVTGVGGTSSNSGGDDGVDIQTGGTITAGGLGSVNVTGTGGASDVAHEIGIYDDGTITSSGGNVSVTGTGGGTSAVGSEEEYGVEVAEEGLITTTVTGSLQVTGSGGAGGGEENYGVYISGDYTAHGVISSAGPQVTVTGNGGGTGASTGYNSGVDLYEGGEIIGLGSTKVQVTGNGGATAGNANLGIYDDGTITSLGGNVAVRGTGGGSSAVLSRDNYGIEVEYVGLISSSVSGSLQVTGTGGTGGGAYNYGIYLSGDSTLHGTISSSGPQVTVTGTGGGSGASSYDNVGVSLYEGGQIVGLGSTSVDVTGTGGASAATGNDGIVVNDNSEDYHTKITVASGLLVLNGTAGSNASSSGSNIGVLVKKGGVVSQTAPGGALEITGSGGTGGSGDVGVEALSAAALSAVGPITIVGDGGGSSSGSDNYGAEISDVAVTSSSAGAIAISGIAGPGTEDDYGVDLSAGASITTAGNINLNGTGGGSSGSTTNSGVYIDDATVEATVNGNVAITGVGGTGSQYNMGVVIDKTTTGSTVSAALGSVTITGTGTGTGAGVYNDGVKVESSTLTDASGSLSVKGTGSTTSTGTENSGIFLSSATITAPGGTGVSLIGTGGAGLGDEFGIYTGGSTQLLVGGSASINMLGVAGTNGSTGLGNVGIELDDATSVTSIASGSIELTGTGAAGSGEESGIVVGSSAMVTATGSGAISLNGTGGASATGQNNYGVQLTSSATVSTVSGNLTLTGVAGAGSGSNYGVEIDSSVTVGGATETGSMTITGTGAGTGSGDGGVRIADDADVNPGSGNLAITGTAAGGSGGSSNDGISIGEHSITLSGGNLTMTGTGGGSGTGGSNNDGILLQNSEAISLTGSGQATLSGTGGGGSSYDYGIQTTSGAYVKTANGNIVVTAKGGGSDPAAGQSNYGMDLEDGGDYSSLDSTGSGNITVTATGGDGSIYAYGLCIQYGGQIQTTSGNVSITAYGGGLDNTDGQYNYGLVVNDGGSITAGGAGNLTATGTGGAGNEYAYGIEMDSGGDLSTVNGNVVLTGTGGGSGSDSSNNYGVYEGAGGEIESTGSGDVSITGFGGTGDSTNIGVNLYTGSDISTNGGDVAITGTGGSSTNASIADGVQLFQMSIAGAGSIQITGTGGSSTSDGEANEGVYIGATTLSSTTGNVSVTGTGGAGYNNDFGVDVESGGEITSGGSGTVTVVGVGGEGMPGPEAEDTEFNCGVTVSGGEISSGGSGAVSVTGTGGDTSGYSDESYGIQLENAGLITSGGGPVTVTGTGGKSIGGLAAYGIAMFTGATITATNSGDVSVNGTGGTGYYNNCGIFANDAQIMGTSGTLSITGVGGSGYNANYGIVLYYDSLVSSTGGNVTVSGTGGPGGEPYSATYEVEDNGGVLLVDGSSVSAGGSGTVSVQGTGGAGSYAIGVAVGMANGPTLSAITSSGGNVSISGTGGGLGDKSGYDDGVDVNEGGELGSGTDASLTITGTGGPGNGFSYGVRVQGFVTTGGGELAITGTGGGHAGDQGYDVGVGVELGGTITEPATPGVINGTGGPGGGYDYGVLVSDVGTSDGTAAPSSISSSHTLNVTGQGGGASGSQGYDDGIHIDSGAEITNSGGTLDLTGTGGLEGVGEDDGIRVTGTLSKVLGGGADLNVVGTGGGAGNSSFNSGVAVLGGGKVEWDGNPSIGTESILANGGAGEGGGNSGLLIDGSESKVALSAQLSGASNIEGYSGQGGVAPGYGISLTNGAEIDGDSGAGGLTLNLDADTMFVDPTSTLDTTANNSKDLNISLTRIGTIEGNVTTSDLVKTNSGALTLVKDGTLDVPEINPTAGSVIFAGAPPFILATNVVTGSGGTLTLGAGSSVPDISNDGTVNGSNPGGNAGTVDDNGGTISPGSPTTAGIIAASTFSLSTTTTVEFKLGVPADQTAQPTPGIDYDQLQVVGDGSYNLNQANLELVQLGNIAPQPGTIYTLVSDPAGTVTPSTFYYDGQPLAEGSMVTVGSTSYQISYHGGAADNNNVILTAIGNTTTIGASLTGATTYGEPVLLVAHVSGVNSSIIPTGIVSFYLGETFLGFGTLDADGNAFFSTSTLPGGTPEVTASYAGSSNFAASSGTFNQTVTQATPVLSLDTAIVGAGVSLVGAVVPNPSIRGAALPTGTVSFYDETTSTMLATDVPLVDAEAVLNLSTLAPGNHTIRFTYDSGDANYSANTVGVTSVVDVPASLSGVQLSAPTVAYTQSSVTLTATINGINGATTGSVSFYDNGSYVGSATPNGNGVATLSVTELSLGTQNFTASYYDPSNPNQGTSHSNTAAINVVTNPITPVTVATTTTVTPIYLPPPSPVPASYGGRNTRLQIAVQLVNAVPDTPTPSGSVTVYASGKVIGVYQLNAQGAVTILLHGKTVFDKSIVVKYNGAIEGITTFAPSSSTPFLANQAFFYGNSPNTAGKSAGAKKNAHPTGPAKAFRSPAAVLHGMIIGTRKAHRATR